MADQGPGFVGAAQDLGDGIPLTADEIEKQEGGDKGRLSRLALGAILLLLLLLCVVTTVADLYLTTPTSKRVVITRNLECLQCHVELIPSFAMGDVHNPFATKRCTTCHTTHGKEVVTRKTYSPAQRWDRLRTLIEWLPLRLACEIGSTPAALTSGGGSTKTAVAKVKGQTSYLRLPENQLCWLCHGNIGPQRSMTYQHAPFKGGYCTSCHNPHASEFRPLLTQSEQDLCVTCHRIGGWINRAQVHPPAGNRLCTSCHHPHASDYKGILTMAQRDLCFTCHPSVAQLSSKAVQHAPFLNDDCTGCHEPHGSNSTPLLIQYQPELCYKCHPNVRLDFLQASHHPVGTVKLNCADCHNPHAADYTFLLDAQDNSFCYECHALKIQATYDPSKHNVLLCIRCHTPHGSSNTPMLRASNPALCLQCHGWVDGSNKHPFQPKFYDVHAQKPLTCTSTCHNPHGTKFKFMVVGYQCPADGVCLQCHLQVGIAF